MTRHITRAIRKAFMIHSSVNVTVAAMRDAMSRRCTNLD